MAAYEITWLTNQLAVGHAPMSFKDLDRIREKGVDAIINLCGEFSICTKSKNRAALRSTTCPFLTDAPRIWRQWSRPSSGLTRLFTSARKSWCIVDTASEEPTLLSSPIFCAEALTSRGRKKLGPNRAAALNYSHWQFLKNFSKKIRLPDAQGG